MKKIFDTRSEKWITVTEKAPPPQGEIHINYARRLVGQKNSRFITELQHGANFDKTHVEVSLTPEEVAAAKQDAILKIQQDAQAEAQAMRAKILQEARAQALAEAKGLAGKKELTDADFTEDPDPENPTTEPRKHTEPLKDAQGKELPKTSDSKQIHYNYLLAEGVITGTIDEHKSTDLKNSIRVIRAQADV